MNREERKFVSKLSLKTGTSMMFAGASLAATAVMLGANPFVIMMLGIIGLIIRVVPMAGEKEFLEALQEDENNKGG